MSQTNRRGAPAPRRKLTPEQRRRILEMRRRQKRRKQLMIAIPAVAVLAVAIVLGLTLPAKGGDRSAAPAVTNAPLELEPAPGAETGAADGSAAPADDAAAPADGSAAPADGSAAPAHGSAAPTDGSGDAVAAGADASAGPAASAGAVPTASPTENPNAYVPTGGVFIYDEAYAAAALGADTGPVLSTDMSAVDPMKLDRWPETKEGYIPILYHAENVTEKVIAVTVDDCFQASNLQQIVQCALDNGGRLTIFPIGDNLAKANIGSVVKWAWQSGMEIENHTYNHAGMYHYDDERMTKEMWMQNMVLNQVLGVNYTEHFFRPKGGDEREDQRVHAYANQMGISAIAIWTQSGSRDSMESLIGNLAPGRIYLFHTTDNDLNKLLQFIPEATRQGYRLVTLNEMFGLPENETSELTPTADPPALQPFRIMIPTLRKTNYIRAAAVVQKRLIELGWLDGEADGVYGQSSFMATGYFQIAAGMKPDGKAGPQTQAVLFAEDAPAATSENRAKVREYMNK